MCGLSSVLRAATAARPGLGGTLGPRPDPQAVAIEVLAADEHAGEHAGNLLRGMPRGQGAMPWRIRLTVMPGRPSCAFIRARTW
jgi:hypothetical protein